MRFNHHLNSQTMQKGKEEKPVRPAQEIKSEQGQEVKMQPAPVYDKARKEKRLEGKVTVITGGDSGIGRAVSIAFAKEGAMVFIVYHEDHEDANKTKELVEQHGVECVLYAGDIAHPEVCR